MLPYLTWFVCGAEWYHVCGYPHSTDSFFLFTYWRGDLWHYFLGLGDAFHLPIIVQASSREAAQLNPSILLPSIPKGASYDNTLKPVVAPFAEASQSHFWRTARDQ